MVDYTTKDTLLGLAAVGGLATGITALSVKKNKSNGCNDGYYNDGADCPISRRESALESEVAMLKAEKSTDAKVLDLYNFTNAKFIETGKQVAENAVQIALNKQANEFQIAAVNREFNNVYGRLDKTDARLDSLTQEIIPISNICPQPLSGCQSIGIQGCIIPTEPTDYTATVLKARAAAAK